QRVAFLATAPQWLGGTWRLDADWDRGDGKGRFDLVADNLDLSVVGQLVAMPIDVTGVGELRATIHAPARKREGRFDAEGTVAARGVGATVASARLDAERIEAGVV